MITPYRSSSSVFMTKNTPSGAKKHRESTESESHQTAKMFFFFFRRASSNLRDLRWFLHKTAAFFTEQCTSPSLFTRLEVTQGHSNCSLKNYGFLYDAIFSSRVRMRTNHLATKCNYYARLLFVCWECLKKACDSSANTA